MKSWLQSRERNEIVYWVASDKQFDGIVVNRMMHFFGKREKWSKS